MPPSKQFVFGSHVPLLWRSVWFNLTQFLCCLQINLRYSGFSRCSEYFSVGQAGVSALAWPGRIPPLEGQKECSLNGVLNR